jgi:hypothetical protein
MSGIASSFLSEGLSLPLMVNNNLKHHITLFWVLE